MLVSHYGHRERGHRRYSHDGHHEFCQMYVNLRERVYHEQVHAFPLFLSREESRDVFQLYVNEYLHENDHAFLLYVHVLFQNEIRERGHHE